MLFFTKKRKRSKPYLEVRSLGSGYVLIKGEKKYVASNRREVADMMRKILI